MPRKRKAVVVTVADESLPSIAAVAEALSAKGMQVERVMPITGVITGSVAGGGRLDRLQSVRGVESVSEESVARLPPSGALVQ